MHNTATKMRYTAPLIAALAATASATAPASSLEQRKTTLYTLELAAGETVEVDEDTKFQMIDVSPSIALNAAPAAWVD